MNKKTLLSSLLLCFFYITMHAQVSAIERAALIALYNAANGPNWVNNTNWGSDKPVGEWYGVTANTNVEKIDLSRNNLTGSISAALGDLQNLKWIDISGNNSLGGSIPAALGDLQNLEHCDLSNNNLGGSIPAALGRLQNLKSLELAGNYLSGSIPKELGDLQNLKTLNASRNKLSGKIPNSFGNLRNLESVYFPANNLTGSIPAALGKLKNLKVINLYRNNLKGLIPPELGELENLRLLLLGSNHLSGPIPATFNNLQKLKYLWVGGNNLSGRIEFVIPSLERFYIEGNAFHFEDIQWYKMHNHSTIFSYLPQGKVDYPSSPRLSKGTSFTMTARIRGQQKHYQWYKDGVAISGATNASYKLDNLQFSDAGVYHCVITSDVIPDLTLIRHNIELTIMRSRTIAFNRIQTIDQTKSLVKNNTPVSVFPNPSRNVLNVAYAASKPNTDVAISIQNLEGHTLLSSHKKAATGNHTEAIDITSLNSGAYFLRFTTSGKTTVKKIFKK